MTSSKSQESSRYLAGPVADTVFLIAAPLIAVLVFIPLSAVSVLSFPLP